MQHGKIISNKSFISTTRVLRFKVQSLNKSIIASETLVFKAFA